MQPWELRGGRTKREWRPMWRTPNLYGEVPAIITNKKIIAYTHYISSKEVFEISDQNVFCCKVASLIAIIIHSNLMKCFSS